MSRRRLILLVVLGAAALTLSYPPFPLPILSFFAVTPAVLLIQQAVTEANPRAAFRWGWWYGLVTNAFVLYWMVVALWHFTPLAALGYFATIAILALLMAVMFWFVVRLRLVAPRVPLWLVFPVAWTALEWLVGHLGDIRFPWLGLGTSLADAPVLVQWADLAGARGVTLWLAWCNVAIVEAATNVRGASYVVRRLAIVIVTVLLALGYGAWRMTTLPLRDVGVIAMVQPNIRATGKIIDASNMIVMPGFIDTHRHAWEAPLRTQRSSRSPSWNARSSRAGRLDSARGRHVSTGPRRGRGTKPWARPRPQASATWIRCASRS